MKRHIALVTSVTVLACAAHATGYFESQREKMNVALSDGKVQTALSLSELVSVTVSAAAKVQTFTINTILDQDQHCAMNVVVGWVDDGSFGGSFEVQSVGQNVCKTVSGQARPTTPVPNPVDVPPPPGPRTRHP